MAVQRRQPGIDAEQDRRAVMMLDQHVEMIDGLVEPSQLREDYAEAVLVERRQAGGDALELGEPFLPVAVRATLAERAPQRLAVERDAVARAVHRRVRRILEPSQ